MLDLDKYKDQFILEAREHLDTLNECVLQLEKDSSDPENINKIFRAFHTLKGNAATMGFMKFSELAHHLEDVLGKIRDKELIINQQITDVILEGCDLLEEGLEEIANNNPEHIDTDRVLHDLNNALHAKHEELNAPVGENAVLDESASKAVEEWKAKGLNVFRVVVVFAKESQLKNLKAGVILRELSKLGTILSSESEQKGIRKGMFDTEIELIFATENSKHDVEAVINRISDLKHVFVLNLDETYKKPDNTANEEKEIAKAAIASKHHADAIKQIQSVKVSMKRLDNLMNLVGELLIGNIRLQDINKKQDYKSLRTVLVEIDRLILDLQDEVMQIRMVPIGNIFSRFPRMIRDLATKEGKKVNLIIEGQDIELDRTVLDEIGEPLVHLLRNCVDHGIETPEQRAMAKKPEEAIIRLEARREKNHAVIEVSDDGAGIDPKKVMASAIKRKTITEQEAAKMSEHDLKMLVFRAGVSTNDIVTEVSGRGVGMDVVLNKLKELGGDVRLESELGEGTKVIMELPLTVAIITSLLVKVGTEIYAIPLSAINQTVNIKKSDIKTIQGNEVFVLRGSEVPIFWLRSLVGQKDFEKKEKLTVVIVNKSGSSIGLVVDSILMQQQVLIKGLQDLVKGTKGAAGATILGDGTVAMILDVGSLL